MKTVLNVCVILAASAANGAQPGNTKAPSQCPRFLGTTVSPRAFDQAFEHLAKISPKGEFETTVQYESRKAAAIGTVDGPLLISKLPESSEYFVYDADQQKLTIKSYAFDNTSFDVWTAFYSAKANTLEASTSGNIEVVISETDVKTGSYEGGNAFGAKAEITKISRTTNAIFQRKAKDYRDTLFVSKGKDGEIGELSLAPADAQALKPQLRLAFVVWPKDPFVIKSEFLFGRTTVSNPREITVHATVLIADIECGLLLDSTNKVLGAYEAQFRN